MDYPGSCPGIVKWGHFRNKAGYGVRLFNYFRVEKKRLPLIRRPFPGSLPVVRKVCDMVSYYKLITSPNAKKQ
jgi:hypothetical protein